jgi:predicted ATP-grasp superfamily ATP-dependent carboligase
LQQYIEGEPCAAVFAADHDSLELLGVTRQLVGEEWLHAGAFTYCGSIGPLRLSAGLRLAFEHLGTTLARGCGLRGLFGIDCVLANDTPWPVEINPRYTASVEVLELATGLAALAHHRAAFDPRAPKIARSALSSSGVVGKAILFAKTGLVFPRVGPWLKWINALDAFEFPSFADIPAPEEEIEKGQPILTLFSHADNPVHCLGKLKQIARELDRWLYEH